MPGQGVVTIGANQWQVDLANTYWELVQGLSGLEGIPAGTGMLFDLGYDHIIQVTTEEMLFNLDIAFISSSLEVVDILQDVAPGNLVASGAAAAYFLEVNAGELSGVEVGDEAGMVFFPGEWPTQAMDWVPMFQQFLMFVVMVGFMMWAVMEVTTPALEEKKAGVGEMEFLSQVYLSEKELREKIAEMEQKMQLERNPDKRQLYGAAKRGDERRLERLKEMQPATRRRQPRRDEVEVEYWEERDRLHVGIREKETGEYVVSWWDDDARQMFEDGFFKPMDPGAVGRRRFEESVLDYAESVGILVQPEQAGERYRQADARFRKAMADLGDALRALDDGCVRCEGEDYIELPEQMPSTTETEYVRILSSGKTPMGEGSLIWREEFERHNKQARERGEQPATGEIHKGGKWKRISRAIPIGPSERRDVPEDLEYFADSPEQLAYTINGSGYRPTLTTVFQEAIERARGMKKLTEGFREAF